MIVGLMLAAGQARRFGSDKRQAVLPSGRALLVESLQAFIPVLDKIGMVIPDDDSFGLAVCEQYGLSALVNAEAHAGIGASLLCGIAWASALAECEGVVVGLADMPRVQEGTVRAVIKGLLAGQGLVVPVYEGQLGHPRGIARSQFAQVLAGGGQAGAQVLSWEKAARVEVLDAGVRWDVDRVGDLQG